MPPQVGDLAFGFAFGVVDPSCLASLSGLVDAEIFLLNLGETGTFQNIASAGISSSPSESHSFSSSAAVFLTFNDPLLCGIGAVLDLRYPIGETDDDDGDGEIPGDCGRECGAGDAGRDLRPSGDLAPGNLLELPGNPRWSIESALFEFAECDGVLFSVRSRSDANPPCGLFCGADLGLGRSSSSPMSSKLSRSFRNPPSSSWKLEGTDDDFVEDVP